MRARMDRLGTADAEEEEDLSSNWFMEADNMFLRLGQEGKED